MNRILAFIYGLTCYLIFFGTFLYAIGFMGGFLVPKSIDSPADVPLGVALAVNVALLLVFALQHSVMARPAFKRWWTRFIPEPIERSTYVLFSSLALILLFWLWQPLGGTVWDVQNTAGRAVLYTLFGLGWVTIFVATLLINHFDLFGLRQVWLYLLGRPYTHLKFTTPGPYKFVRHPLYVGWLIAIWTTPTMTMAHLAFAVGTTAYILIAIQFEERDLIDYHGDDYSNYCRRVPMLLPRLLPRRQWQEQSA